MGNARVCMSLLLRIFRAKEIYNTKCWVSTSISTQFQFRLTDTFTNYHEIYPFSQRTSAVIFKHVFLKMKLKHSSSCKDVLKKKKKFKKSDVLITEDWSIFYTGFPVHWALTYYCFFWSLWKWLWKWLQMQLYKHFCFKIPILHCNAIFSNIVLVIFTVNREAVFP